MGWINIAQQDNQSANSMEHALAMYFQSSSRFYIGEHYYRLDYDRHNGKWAAEQCYTESDEVADRSPSYSRKSTVLKWIANAIPSYLGNGSDSDQASATEFNASYRVSIGLRTYTPYADIRSGTGILARYAISSYPNMENAMRPHRSKRPTMSIQVNRKDAYILQGYLFSRFYDLAYFITSKHFKDRVLSYESNPAVYEDHYEISTLERDPRSTTASLIAVMHELADLQGLSSGIIITGKTLIDMEEANRIRATTGNDPLDASISEDFADITPTVLADDIFLSFRMSTVPDLSKLEPYFSALNDIVQRFFPQQYKVEIIHHDLGPMVAVHPTGLKPVPKTTKPFEAKPFYNQDFDVEFTDPEEFGITLASTRKRPMVVSFDYDGTTVFPELRNGQTQVDEYGELVSTINPEAAELMQLYAQQGAKIIIVTCRTPDSIDSIWKMVNDNNLPVSEVHTTSHTDKSPVLEQTGASVHYDDSQFRSQEIIDALGPSIQVHKETDMQEKIKSMRKACDDSPQGRL